MPSYTESDKSSLVVRPAFTYIRDYLSSEPFALVALVNGASFNSESATQPLEFHDFGTIAELVDDETGTVSLSIGQVFNLQLISKLTGRLFTYSQTDGDPVNPTAPDDNIVVVSGDWSFDQPILLSHLSKTLNNRDVKPTFTSVTGSDAGALTVATDYNVAWLEGSGWAIVPRESVTLDDEDQSLTIIIAAYTPIASSHVTRGGRKVVEPIEVKFDTYDFDGIPVSYKFHYCFATGTFGHTFSPENSAEPVLAEITLNVKRDTTRTEGDQLMSVMRGNPLI